jgi:hypothetical protein
MRRSLILTGVAIAVLLVALQVGLPLYLEGRVEDRLTDSGGTADVDIDAFPSVRLLGSDGDNLRVRGRGYRLDIQEPEEKVFERIDGFDQVDIDVSSFRVGPFEIDRFRLTRDNGSDFRMLVAASATPRDLTTYAAGELGGELGELFAQLGSGLVPGTGTPIPVALDATLESRDGRARVEEVDGTVAGLPAGPLAEALAGAVADRL